MVALFESINQSINQYFFIVVVLYYNIIKMTDTSGELEEEDLTDVFVTHIVTSDEMLAMLEMVVLA